MSSQMKCPCSGAGCSQCAETRPSPSCRACSSSPADFSDAKSFLTLPDYPVSFGNSRVWQPTISLQTSEVSAASNPCQRSFHVTWEQTVPHPHHEGTYLRYRANKFHLSTTPRPLRTGGYCGGCRRDLELRLMSSARQEGAAPQPGRSPRRTPVSQGSAQQDFKPPQQQTTHLHGIPLQLFLALLCSC